VASVLELLGDFAVVLWGPRIRELLCGRDPLGVKPLYYHLSPRLVAFATDMTALLVLPGASRDLDEPQIALQLAWEQPDREGTVYRDIRRLPAAHVLRVSDEGRVGLPHRYWNPADCTSARGGRRGSQAEEF